ncbi:ornithine carbamoyltransferase [Phaffia rhodozyma]|uniref:ornithine carbamoyltransferase n=1 Tax=Phaffia rhodozyma TaxID=264483 RepID=A0A0F7SHH6_PHARH|nr:ornithine carbamoyltransferase [Phaffia rhodozyma]
MSFRTTASLRLSVKPKAFAASPFARAAYTTSSTSTSSSSVSSGQTAPVPVPVAQRPVKHFLDLHSLSPEQITGLITQAQQIKSLIKPPSSAPHKLQKTLTDKTVALLFSKRSTRTRIASETSAVILGGHPMFLGPADIQLGVNESLKDTAHIIGSMADGIMARVGAHAEVETLAKYSGIPVINALSDLYHPTQTLASLLTLARIYAKRTPTAPHFAPPTPVVASQAEASKPAAAAAAATPSGDGRATKPLQKTSWNDLWSRAGNGSKPSLLTPLQGLKVAWVGDCNNVVNDMIVTYPRLGIDLRVASPGGKNGAYGLDKRVEAKLDEFGLKHAVTFTSSPEEALKDADVVVTDTWISMGQEEESARRLRDFAGFQITEELCKRAGANPDWKFMHCLPRHQDEVDDEVFYGPRSTVFEEAENRKHTICSVFK